MKILSIIIIVSFISLCRSHRSFSKKNNYLQFLRSQNFIQEKPKYKKLNKNYSEDLNEFDDYEDEQTYNENEVGHMSNKQLNNNNLENYNNNNENKLDFKDIENELNNDELLRQDSNINLVRGGKECTINEKGIINVSIDSNDIFNLNKYNVEITSSNILIKDINDLKIIKSIPFKSIKLPIETIEETRECWNIKLNKEKILFCEQKKEDRDIWITNILKALFCYNTNNLMIEKSNTSNNESIHIPKESTVEERLKASKEGQDISNNNSPQYIKSSNYNNINISNLRNDEPKILFD
ncbi:conserved Plasmodium protein, unknown function [Plasmodium gallinaceum]|uniref:Crystalloid-specific PH domain-containing protein n=1 Tax=Plasmodium gallinaceum TaxID=5849 RepID=A0A1J1GMC5_PLAGA|nr:conserved Plasmodium protein, unknown function [Plasmodium gallinaceum]CRG93483.1 conserved Plasmodium protein, unknown function [Plasmodium gallinaceum]